MKILLMLVTLMCSAISASAGEEFREINGVTLSVKEDGESSPMILIHGRGYSKEYMDSLFDRFKGKYHVFSYDTRGHGKSDKPESFTLDDDADRSRSTPKALGRTCRGLWSGEACSYWFLNGQLYHAQGSREISGFVLENCAYRH